MAAYTHTINQPLIPPKFQRPGALRIIQVICDIGHLDTIKDIVEQREVADFWCIPATRRIDMRRRCWFDQGNARKS